MIANKDELEIAFHDLKGYERALEAVRSDLERSNPALFPVVSKGYTRRIQGLQEEIFAYLRERPADAPLKVRMAGPAVAEGAIKVGLVARVLTALQSALLQVGKSVDALTRQVDSTSESSLSALLGLNLVATQTGSFVLALDLAPRQLNLFEEYDVAERAVLQLINHIAELSEPRDGFSGDKSALRSLDRLASLINADRVDTIEFSYRSDKAPTRVREATITLPVKEKINTLLKRPRAGEETVRGLLLSINIERNTCGLRPEGQNTVQLNYQEDMEDDLILALKRQIEVSGIRLPLSGTSDQRKNIERFRLVDADDEEA